MSQAPSPRRTLKQAIAAADARLTVLDDKIDVEDHAVYRWLRGHQVHAGHLHHLVIGSDPLAPAWQAQTLKIAAAAQAAHLLQSAAHDPIAMRSLEAAWREIEPHSTAKGAELVAQVTAALASGRMWAIEARHAPHSRFSTRTSPTAFAPINLKLGTNVDFAFIAKLEGDQWLRGNIPIKRTGVVIGRSGMTVASGFDVGQWKPSEIKGLGFPPALLAKLLPFAHHPFRHWTKDEVAATVAKLGPVPVLTKAEADLCDGAVFEHILKGAIAAWDLQPTVGVPAFAKLPSGWQTVWLSRYYQEGADTHMVLGIQFRRQARDGEWTKAIATLRSYTEYTLRAAQEAKLLEAELPASPPGRKSAK